MDRAALAINADEGEVADSIESFDAMRTLARDISPRDARGVMKTFGIALNLVNAAEVHHRVRLVRTMAREAAASSSNISGAGPLPNVEDSICGTMEILLNGENKVDPDKIFQRLITQKCEIVLTAHPTEVNRKTLIRKCEFFLLFVAVVRESLVSRFFIRYSISFSSFMPTYQTMPSQSYWHTWSVPICNHSSVLRHLITYGGSSLQYGARMRFVVSNPQSKKKPRGVTQSSNLSFGMLYRPTSASSMHSVV